MEEAAKLIMNANHVTAFTGAGISVESGIPPFRGKDGLWSRYDPIVLDIDYFQNNPKESWLVIKEIFYDFFGEAKPNTAHFALAELEKMEIIKSVITQNIDNLHQHAGIKEIYEFHGNSRNLICTSCSKILKAEETSLSVLPLKCNVCGTVLKSDFVFFGEPIPEPARSNSFNEAENADIFLLIDTTGEIMPASIIPQEAKRNGVKIIEINVETTNFTKSITDLFIEGKATEVMAKIYDYINKRFMSPKQKRNKN
jgi:NAD-dependent deacetylase